MDMRPVIFRRFTAFKQNPINFQEIYRMHAYEVKEGYCTREVFENVTLGAVSGSTDMLLEFYLQVILAALLRYCKTFWKCFIQHDIVISNMNM